MNRQHDPLDPQERVLARLLDQAEQPPPELDARILAAARGEVRASGRGPAMGTRRRRRWPVALGLAASLTLAVGVAWQLREPPQPSTAAMASFPVAAEKASGAAADAASPAGASARPAPPAPVVEPVPPPADTPARPAPLHDRAASVARVPAAGAQRAEKEQRVAELQAGTADRGAAPSEPAGEPEAAAAFAAQEVARALPAAAPPPPPSPVPAASAPVESALAAADEAPAARARVAAETAASHLPPPSLAIATGVPEDLGPAAAAAVGEDQRLAAPEWLQRIRERRDRGEVELARASLARFMVTHPTTPVPEDLQPLAP